MTSLQDTRNDVRTMGAGGVRGQGSCGDSGSKTNIGVVFPGAWARCFREIGVLQPLVCTASRDKGAKSRSTEGRRARGGCLRFAKYLVD